MKKWDFRVLQGFKKGCKKWAFGRFADYGIYLSGFSQNSRHFSVHLDQMELNIRFLIVLLKSRNCSKEHYTAEAFPRIKI